MKTIQKITSVFLAIIFLFSSLGFTISSMVCLKSGKGKISFAIIEDCCSKSKQEAPVSKTGCCNDEKEFTSTETFAIITKGDCCDINNYTYKLNDFQNSQKLAVEQPIVLNSIFHTSEFLPVPTSEKVLTFYYTNLPPPLHGRTLLNFISTLTI